MAHHGTFIDHLTHVQYFNTNYMVTRGNQGPPILKF